MPIYEYECQKCGSIFELMQPVSAKPLKTCTGVGCNGRDNGKVQRLVSASSFVLKGSGWYVTDYPSEARKKGMEQETKASGSKVSSKGSNNSNSGHSGSANTESNSKSVEKKAAPKKSSERKSAEKSPKAS